MQKLFRINQAECCGAGEYEIVNANIYIFKNINVKTKWILQDVKTRIG